MVGRSEVDLRMCMRQLSTCGALIDFGDARPRAVRRGGRAGPCAGARARTGRAALLARPLGLSRAFRDPRLARRGGALQADGHRRRLGDGAARF